MLISGAKAVDLVEDADNAEEVTPETKEGGSWLLKREIDDTCGSERRDVDATGPCCWRSYFFLGGRRRAVRTVVGGSIWWRSR